MSLKKTPLSLLFLFCISSAHAIGIAIDSNTVSNNSGAATVKSWPHPCTGCNMIVVGLAEGNNIAITSVSYGNVGLNEIRVDTNSVGPTLTSLWYLVNPPTGTNNVVINMSGSCLFIGDAISFTGVNPVTPIDVSSATPTANISSSIMSSTVTTTVSNDWLIDVLVSNNGMGGNPSVLQVLRSSQTITTALSSQASTQGSLTAGSHFMSWTPNAGSFAQPMLSIVAIEPANARTGTFTLSARGTASGTLKFQ